MIRRVESPSGARIFVDGREILNFGGCSYLGLSNHPELLAAGTNALTNLGPIAQIPRHYGFALAANLDVEAEAAQFFDAEAAMYFSTGYLFGLISLCGLAAEYDIAFLDASTHYSLRDGAAAAGKPVHSFAHLDPDDLARVLAAELKPGQRPLAATDGMFPTFGSIAPLADYARVLAPYDGWLIVDESHSFGAIGPTGGGAVEHHGLERDRVVAGGSMSKAFCAFGGLAVGSREVIDELWKSPAARGAASGISSGAAMTAASLRYVRQHPERLEKLRRNVRQLKAGVRALGYDIEDSDAPVATFVAGKAQDMQRLHARLLDDGIYVIYSNYVGAGAEGAIRCAVFADHEPDEIERLLAALA